MIGLSHGADKLPSPIITRFAPSPTGYLHLGHIASALFVDLVARARQGQVILRIEDHDQGRSRQEFVDAIAEDLDYLGFRYQKTTRQMASPRRYQLFLEKLRQVAQVYNCDCTRRQIKERMDRSGSNFRNGGGDEELFYDGYCRTRRLEGGEGVVPRLRLGTESIEFIDLWQGKQTQVPGQQCGDLPLKSRDGYWSYQFAVVCDDIDQGINVVVRGKDLLSSTGRQILLWNYLSSAPPPHYAHHSLVNDQSGMKLSKRFLSASIREMRTSGSSRESILGKAAFAAGLLPEYEPVTLSELVERCDVG